MGSAETGQHRRGRGAWQIVALGWLILISAAALLAPWLPLQPYDQTNYTRTLLGPGVRLSEPLGTDQLGRSIVSRVVWGARTSLFVGAFATAIGLVVGGSVGLAIGYLRGGVDRFVMWLTDLILAFPPLVFLMTISAIFGRDALVLSAALGVLAVPTFVRLSRASTLTHSTREYVLAARVVGATPRRIMTRDLLPNVLPALLAYSLVIGSLYIVAEGSLGFIGLGVQRPNPSWGGMIAQGRSELSDHPHIVVAPALALYLTVLALNSLSDRLQQALGLSSPTGSIGAAAR